MLWALQERPSEQRAERGAYGEQQSWNGGWDTLPIRSFYWQKRWQMQSARNKLLLELTGHAPVMSRHKAWEEGSYSGTAQPPSEKLHILPAWHCRGITLQESSAPSRNLRKKWHSARKKGMRAVLGASQAQAELRVFSCGWISMANPEVFQDSPFFLRFPWQGKGLLSISWQQELSKRLLGFAKITRRKIQLISGQHYRKREKTEPGIKGRDEQWKSRLS